MYFIKLLQGFWNTSMQQASFMKSKINIILLKKTPNNYIYKGTLTIVYKGRKSFLSFYFFTTQNPNCPATWSWWKIKQEIQG